MQDFSAKQVYNTCREQHTPRDVCHCTEKRQQLSTVNFAETFISPTERQDHHFKHRLNCASLVAASHQSKKTKQL